MYKNILHRAAILIHVFIFMLVGSGCSQPQIQETVNTQGGFVKIAPGAYDSADTAIVVSKEESKKKITFLNLKKKKNYTLNYDGTTKFMDKYGSQISVSQLEEGEMVDVRFLKEDKLLCELEVSSEIWTLNDISKFELDLAAGRMKIMNEYYTLDETTVVVSNGKQIEFIELNPQDVIQVKGMDHKIYSIAVQDGHGYLRLENAEYFVGGWIEVGQKIIQKIEEDMLITVPEGTYDVYLSHSGIEGNKQVEIKRNQETSLDVGDLKKEDLVKYGNIIFTVDPSAAQVYIDGKVIDVSRTVKVEYGLHQIMAKAEGYDTVIQYIRVTKPNANVNISLEEETVHNVSENSTDNTQEDEKEETTDTSNSSSSQTNTSENKETTESQKESEEESESESKAESATENSSESSAEKESEESSADSSTTGYKVTIEAPQGAEVYVDGNYVGIIPVSFAKKEGSHEITIRKNGYMTRSYTIKLDNEEKDINYSFSDLTPME